MSLIIAYRIFCPCVCAGFRFWKRGAAMDATTRIQMAARRGEKGGEEKGGKEEGEATGEFNLLLPARTLTSLYIKFFFMFFAWTF